MADVGDAVNQGFVASLARPGGSITGLSSFNAEVSAKRLEFVKEAIPTVSRVAVVREAVGDASPMRSIEAAPMGGANLRLAAPVYTRALKCLTEKRVLH